MRKRVVVANRIHASVRGALSEVADLDLNEGEEPWSADELLGRCRAAHALMAFMTETVDRRLVEACPNLEIVAGALKGYNNIDVAACTENGVLLTIVPDLLTAPTAELAVGMMIAVARNILPGDAHVRSGAFQGWRPRFYGASVAGATVGLIGAGAVGRAIMDLLSGFRCRKLYFDTARLPPEEERRLGAAAVGLEQLRAEADFVVLAIHLNAETRHLVDASFLAGMKPGAFLINPARGSLVDEAAVAAALAAGHLGGYAADTFGMEDWTLPDRPREIDPAILASGRTVLTPHLGSAVAAAREAIERAAADSIVDHFAGRLPATAVNAAALRRARGGAACG